MKEKFLPMEGIQDGFLNEDDPELRAGMGMI